MMKNKLIFSSSLGSLLKQFVEHNKMRGYKYESGEYAAHRFDVFVAASQVEPSTLTKELVESYIALRPGEKPSTQSHRISLMRCFGKYLVRCSFDAYVLPYGMSSVVKYGFVPHVFSSNDVARVISAADSLPYHANSPKRHIVIPMMLRLIYGCGLRLSEAINLNIENVDINTGVIFVRATKFNKDRYVPMAFSLLGKCRIYATKILASNIKALFKNNL